MHWIGFLYLDLFVSKVLLPLPSRLALTTYPAIISIPKKSPGDGT